MCPRVPSSHPELRGTPGFHSELGGAPKGTPQIWTKMLDKNFGNFWRRGRGRYASCSHAGRLSCYCYLLFHVGQRKRLRIKLVTCFPTAVLLTVGLHRANYEAMEYIQKTVWLAHVMVSSISLLAHYLAVILFLAYRTKTILNFDSLLSTNYDLQLNMYKYTRVKFCCSMNVLVLEIDSS